uniref:BPTI/Kunitz inhibitor domain-containing protein n=1 Tax=Heligmosomoides polygyrus TaxID=6339 RepID=A0A183F2R1_HELPZ
LSFLGGGAPPIALPTLPPPPTTTTVPPLDVCSLPPLTGTCNRARIMWYYDTETGMCERFSFSGCGNLNRFPSKIQCEQMCLRRG